MNNRNAGVVADTLFVGATRPSMLWGASYASVMLNCVCVMELFLLTKNLLTLLLAAPIHGVCALLCARDPRFFDLLLLWARTAFPALLANKRFWKASSYSPLALDLARINGRHQAPVSIRIGHRSGVVVNREFWGPPHPAWRKPHFPSPPEGEGPFLPSTRTGAHP